ncbi:MAG: right-handed parallel beta-helix repeat-containing protein [Fibrobacterales bacterium]
MPILIILLLIAPLAMAKDYNDPDPRCNEAFTGDASTFTPTEICGDIQLPTSLRKCKSPYLVTDDIYIPASSRLRIEAGVELIISKKQWCHGPKDSLRAMSATKWKRQIDWNDSQYVSIKVEGAFFIAGTEKEPVIIRPENTTLKRATWDGIRLKDKSHITTQIEYLHISGADKAINIKHSTFNIANSLFKNNNVGIAIDKLSIVPIYNSVFTENYSAGIFHKHSGAKLYANIFYNNFNYGIWADSRHSLVAYHNIFFDNREADCFHCPLTISQISTINDNGDSTDSHYNLFKDPIFVGSAQEAEAIKKDLDLNTPKIEIKDTILYHLELKSRKHKNLGLKKVRPFIPRGPQKGPYRLSKYSPGIHGAPSHSFFMNSDSSQGDVGLYGGTNNRVGRRFPK